MGLRKVRKGRPTSRRKSDIRPLVLRTEGSIPAPSKILHPILTLPPTDADFLWGPTDLRTSRVVSSRPVDLKAPCNLTPFTPHGSYLTPLLRPKDPLPPLSHSFPSGVFRPAPQDPGSCPFSVCPQILPPQCHCGEVGREDRDGVWGCARRPDSGYPVGTSSSTRTRRGTPGAPRRTTRSRRRTARWTSGTAPWMTRTRTGTTWGGT